MNIWICLVLASLAFGLPTIPKVRRSKRAIGGQPAAPNQFPFIVSLMSDGEHRCGGSIINENWIVTAAHCVNDYFPYTILAGTNLLDTGGTLYKVDQIIIHPKYTDFPLFLINDIALVKIEGAFAFDESVRPIEVGKVSPGDLVTLIGWGYTEYINRFIFDKPNALQFANVVALSNRDCVKKAKNGIYKFNKHRGKFCALSPERVAPCYGDSGGPLVFNGTLVGIFSSMISPCAKGFPDIYTKAHHYIHWINNIVNNTYIKT